MYIALEGPDFTGKSTQISNLKNYYESKGYNVITTKEPGGSSIGHQIRHLLFGEDSPRLNIRTEQVLQFAERIQLNYEVIKQHYSDPNTIILSDRCYLSGFAYGSVKEGGLSVEPLLSILDHFIPIKPDLVLVLLINHNNALERADNRNDWSHYDKWCLENYERLIEAYRMWSTDPRLFKYSLFKRLEIQNLSKEDVLSLLIKEIL